MKVFISWSGQRSKQCAEIFAQWLPQVIQVVEPWISTDIEKGSRWTPEISSTLESSKIGIVCLTRENLKNEWILFEAGALSKIPETKVCTFLLDLNPTDIEQPLSQFMHTVFTKEDILRLLITINTQIEKAGERSLPETTLKLVFETFWPQLDSQIQGIKSLSNISKPKLRKDREIIEEILELVRKIYAQPPQPQVLQTYSPDRKFILYEAFYRHTKLMERYNLSKIDAFNKVLEEITKKYQLSLEGSNEIQFLLSKAIEPGIEK